MYWRRKWQPTPVFLPGESQEWGSLVGCRLLSLTELDTTEATQQQQQQQYTRSSSNGKFPHRIYVLLPIHQFISVTQSCPTLCDPMDCSTSGLPIWHQLPEFTQTHFHRVHDAFQPSHPLSSPSPPTFNLSQHQGLFK